MRAKRAAFAVLVVAMIVFVYFAVQGPEHELVKLNEFGEGFIVDSSVEVYRNSWIPLQTQGDWKYGGTTVTQVSWTYSVTIQVRNIAHYNVTIKFGYKLGSASSVTQLDSKALTLQTANQTVQDTGSESIETHTGRYVSSPQDGTTYYFDYYVQYTIQGIGAKSGEPIVVQSGWIPKQTSVGLEYSESFGISTVIVHEYGYFDDPDPSAGTDVTDIMTNGAHGYDADGVGGFWDWASGNTHPYVTFKITFQGSKDAKLRFYFTVVDYSVVQEQDWGYIAELKRSSDGFSWDSASAECDGPYGDDSYVTSYTYTLEGTQYWRVEFYRMVDYEDEFYVSEIEVIENTSSWFYGVAGFAVGFLVAFGIAFYALRRRR